MLNKTYIPAIMTLLIALPAAGETVDLRLEDAWVRAMPPSQSHTAAYLTLVNEGESAYAVVGATADVARNAEIHTTRKVNGYMRMEQLEGLAVAPGERVELAPGGTHVMLMGLPFMPELGDIVKLCLQLHSGEQVCTEAVTRR